MVAVSSKVSTMMRPLVQVSNWLLFVMYWELPYQDIVLFTKLMWRMHSFTVIFRKLYICTNCLDSETLIFPNMPVTYNARYMASNRPLGMVSPLCSTCFGDWFSTQSHRFILIHPTHVLSNNLLFIICWWYYSHKFIYRSPTSNHNQTQSWICYDWPWAT